MSLRAMLWAFDSAPDYLTATQRHVLVALADHVDDNTSQAWPSILRLARRTGRSESAVRRSLQAIEDAGIITRQIQQAPTRGPDWSRPNLYLWHPAESLTGSLDRLPVDKPPVRVTPPVPMTPPPCTGDTPPPVRVTPEQLLEHSDNPLLTVRVDTPAVAACGQQTEHDPHPFTFGTCSGRLGHDDYPAYG
jgi:predicted transcriptional regulator